MIHLSEKEKNLLLALSRQTLSGFFKFIENKHCMGARPKHTDVAAFVKWFTGRIEIPDIPLLSENLSCFVTLTEGHRQNLRGCIGSLEPQPDENLLQNLIHHSLHAAFFDNRFEPLDSNEIYKVKIEISILSRPTPINYTSMEDLFQKIQQKGVVLKQGFYQATFLPQVWKKITNPKDFLKQLAQKAGLPQSNYYGASYQVYSVCSFEEKQTY